MIKEPELEFVFEIDRTIVSSQLIGDTPHGGREIVEAGDGTFIGPRVRGRTLPGGVDCLLTRPDGVREMDGRTVYQTDDGALLYFTFGGYYYQRDAPAPDRPSPETASSAEPYFVLTAACETSAPQYAWLTKHVLFGLGEGTPGGVRFRVYAVK